MTTKSFKLSGSYPAARVGKVVVSGFVLFGVIIFMLMAPGHTREMARADAEGRAAGFGELFAAALPPFGTIFAIAIGVTLVCGLALSIAAWADDTRAG